jgi:phosphatidylglycerol:prolipoprotein diacylglycerol transferase
MIDPIIFTITLFGIQFSLRWYGLILMTAAVVGTWIAARQYKHNGGNPEVIWDAMPIVLIAGVVGARLWYVLNATLGGSRYFTDNPVKILAIPEGGLHIFGAFLFGGVAAYIYARRRNLDLLMLLDSAAPAMLIGQALARPANYINQELYGQPTGLPWGIPIAAENRIPPYNDLGLYPAETTRFHPTFAYEMIWNLAAGGFLLWLSHRYPERLKPGALFACWLILAGTGRFVIESFRPDQPRIPGTDLSFSRLISLLMAVLGVIWLLARYGYLRIPLFTNAPEKYRITPTP